MSLTKCYYHYNCIRLLIVCSHVHCFPCLLFVCVCVFVFFCFNFHIFLSFSLFFSFPYFLHDSDVCFVIYLCFILPSQTLYFHFLLPEPFIASLCPYLYINYCAASSTESVYCTCSMSMKRKPEQSTVQGGTVMGIQSHPATALLTSVSFFSDRSR